MLVLCCNDYHTHTSYDFFKHLPCAFQNKKDFTRQKTCVFKKAVGIKVNSGTSLRLSRVIVMTPSASQQVHKQALVFEHTVVAGFYDILGSFFFTCPPLVQRVHTFYMLSSAQILGSHWLFNTLAFRHLVVCWSSYDKKDLEIHLWPFHDCSIFHIITLTSTFIRRFSYTHHHLHLLNTTII